MNVWWLSFVVGLMLSAGGGPQLPHVSARALQDACGFKSVPTFCNEFKRATGLTPREWRRLR